MARRALVAALVAVALAAGCGGGSGSSGSHSADDVSSALKDAGFTRVSVTDASGAGSKLGAALPGGVADHLDNLIVAAKPDLTIATVLVLDDSSSAGQAAKYLRGVAKTDTSVIVHDNLVGLAVGSEDTRSDVSDVINGI